MTTPAALTQKAFAEHIGCRPSYITKLKQDGRLVIGDDGLVRVAESIARIEATRDPAKRAVAERHATERGATLQAPAAEGADKPAEDPATLANPDYQAARAKREHYAAEREEMRYRQEAAELLVAVEVEGEVASILTELRTRLEALPDTLGPQLAPIADEQQVRTRLAEEIELALGEVARCMGGVA